MALIGSRNGNTRRTNRKATVSNTHANALDFAVTQKMNSMETASLAVVNSGGGKLSVTPQVTPTDNFGTAVPTAAASGVPSMSLQAKGCGIILPPQPGDQVLVVYTKADSSNIGQGSTDSVTPASNRMFSPANGIAVGAVNMSPPTDAYVKFSPEDGKMEIYSKDDITIECKGTLTLKAEGGIVIESAGGVQMASSGGMDINTAGGVTFTGGNLTSNGKVLETHTHPGDSGGVTGGPN
jgi:phage baseplate assembly protein gpV